MSDREPIIVAGRECAFFESIDFKDQWFVLDAKSDLILSPNGTWIECDKARYGFGHPYAGYYRQEFKHSTEAAAREFASDPLGHKGRGGHWEPGVGPCVCDVCKAERAAIAAAHSQPGKGDADGWRTIDSAPKDGTDVLLVWHWSTDVPGHRGVDVVLARWICRKHAHLSRRHDCPNESDCNMGWDHYAGTMSHWQPLPTPPTQEQSHA